MGCGPSKPVTGTSNENSPTMAPSKIKITNFNLRARVEIARLVLAVAKVDYEFVGVEFSEWPAMKPTIPTGSLPMLEVEDRKFGQGIAIQTYLAETYGLYGRSPMDHLIIDQISLCREDMLIPETKHFLCADKDEQKKIETSLREEHYPKYCELFTKFIEQGSKDFILGAKISLADFVIFEAFTTLSQNHPDIYKKYPKVVAFREKVAKNAEIKKYIDSKKGTTPM